MKKKKKDKSFGCQTVYPKSPNTGLPQNYTVRDGFLFKDGNPVSLVTSGIVEAATQGFLHIDETGKYKTE